MSGDGYSIRFMGCGLTIVFGKIYYRKKRDFDPKDQWWLSQVFIFYGGVKFLNLNEKLKIMSNLMSGIIYKLCHSRSGQQR